MLFKDQLPGETNGNLDFDKDRSTRMVLDLRHTGLLWTVSEICRERDGIQDKKEIQRMV